MNETQPGTRTDTLLASLREPAPDGFASRVLADVGLADRYVVRRSPVGDVAVAHNAAGISACRVLDGGGTASFEAWFADHFGRPVTLDDAPRADLLDAVDRLLAGRPVDPVPAYDLRSVSAFARKVLTVTCGIPAGEVRSYGWIAATIGQPGATRAVGTALGRNPIPLLIPCHRVVRNDGKIGNYAFGSPMKRALLAFEGADLTLS
ncbi:MAG TPA: methylated-DNA--[protein]-cysteine S-methyltransferase [Acidimicrobiales bacterium]